MRRVFAAAVLLGAAFLVPGCGGGSSARRAETTEMASISLPPETRTPAEIAAAERAELAALHGRFAAPEGALAALIAAAGADLAARQPEGGRIPPVILLPDAKRRVFGTLFEGSVFLSGESAKGLDSPEKALAMLVLGQEYLSVDPELAAAKRRLVEAALSAGVNLRPSPEGKIDVGDLTPATRAAMVERGLAIAALHERARSRAAARLAALGLPPTLLKDLLSSVAADGKESSPGASPSKVEI